MSFSAEWSYINLLEDLLRRGEYREGRNGGTFGLFGRMLRFGLHEGALPVLPVLTTKRVHFKSVVAELLWFLRGETTLTYLHARECFIWNEWADENGELGPIYSRQWRDFRGVDQIAQVIHSLKTEPFSRRHIVSAWNPVDVPQMGLPPCHVLFQFHVSAEGRLSCHMTQRSADAFLGLPFNIASYGLLTHLIAREVGLKPGNLILSLGDVHLYENHVEQAREQVKRRPGAFPEIRIADRPGAFQALLDRADGAFDVDDFELLRYAPAAAIKAPVSK